MMGQHDGGRGVEHRTPLYASTSESSVPLRVVLVTPVRVPQWLSVFVSESLASRSVELDVALMSHAPPRRVRAMPFDVRLFLGLERVLFRLLGRITGRRPTGPLSPVSLDMTRHASGRVAHADTESLLAGVRESRADLVLLHGAPELAPMLAPLARHGCWMLDPDITEPDCAGLALLAPILRGDSATELNLYLVSGAVGTETADALATSHGATSPMSFSQQRDLAFAKLPAMLLRVLRGFAASRRAGEPAAIRSLRVSPPSFTLHGGLGLKSFFVAVRQFLRWRGRRIRARHPWFLLVPTGASPLDPTDPAIGRHAVLVAPGQDYWADPYPVMDAGRRLLFVEELVHARSKGIIICLELLDDDVVVRRGVVLDEDAHLSYPQVFQWDGAWYMTVESCEANRVSLYAADEFPLRWRRIADLVEGHECVDPTLHHHEGRWYLFANISESGGGLSDELFLFTSDTLAGPYRPHPANPILSDARMSRPAGRLFRHEGRLVRPSQCCVPIYGTAVVFNEVLELTPESYRERPMATLKLDAMPDLDGCHTYNSWYGFEALDAHGRPPAAGARMRVVEPDRV
ncbi:hypothetical protein ACFONC_03810 [Luteimonas soli]|uniref:Glucosamine inositolphosphorylceramide transferase 1 N-terminal domain-containing protein n=1 Tax=Luteimonas soli TaxID=1648966 RepID=A0ABV7XIZ6_9GAMM